MLSKIELSWKNTTAFGNQQNIGLAQYLKDSLRNEYSGCLIGTSSDQNTRVLCSIDSQITRTAGLAGLEELLNLLPPKGRRFGRFWRDSRFHL